MAEERIEIPKPQGHNCFACGTENPIGLNLQFYRLADTVCTELTLQSRYEGWEGVVHGGIVSTLLDEVMSWAIMYTKKVFLVTRKMDIKYVRPVLVGTPLKVAGRLVDDSEPPKIKARAEIRDEQGGLLVRSNAEFVEIPKENFSGVTEDYKEKMLSLFEKFPTS
ncbi:MAG: PaaI family thioesterase, partial [Desulfobacterales bacterium]|nr:PaaI family thioesterase [Desulfobacterales bacterium]